MGFAHAIFSTHNFAHMCGDKMCYENILCVYAYKCMCSLFFFKEIFVKQYFSCCYFLFLIVYMNWVTGVCGIYTYTVFSLCFLFLHMCAVCIYLVTVFAESMTEAVSVHIQVLFQQCLSKFLHVLHLVLFFHILPHQLVMHCVPHEGVQSRQNNW